MAKVFSFNANRGSYYSDQQVLGVKTGTIPFVDTVKGLAIKLSSAGNFSWTVPSFSCTNFLIGIRGSGSVNVTTGATTTIITATNNWVLQNTSGLVVSGGTVVTIAWTSGTVFISLLEVHNGLSATELNRSSQLFNIWQVPKGLKKSSPIAYSEFKEESIREVNATGIYTFKKGSNLDVSGNNKTLTFNKTISTINGIRTLGVSNSYILTPFTEANLTAYTTGRIRFRCKFLANATGAIFDIDNGGTDFRLLFQGTASVITFSLFSPSFGGYRTLNTVTNSWTLNTWYQFEILYGIGGMRIYVNGVLNNSNALTDKMTNSVNLLHFGSYGTKTGGNLAIEFEDIRISNENPTTAQIQLYHNKFASRITARDTGFGEAVGNQPREWEGIGSTAGVPNIVWDELTADNTILGLKKGFKLHKCNVADTYSIKSTSPSGTFRSLMYKTVDAGTQDWFFIANIKGGIGTTGLNCYMVRFAADEKFYIYKVTNGAIDGGAVIAGTGTYTLNTLYSIEVRVTTSGGFTLLLQGGTVASLTQIGTGTSTTYTTSGYQNVSNNANDKFLLGTCTEGIIL